MATSIVETITPQKAMEFLKTSKGNRNISKPVVDSYALTMKSGGWMLNGEAIVFDQDGHLINGHHRLHAVIKSGVPVESFVARGVSDKAFVTFDCGRHRTVGQLIGMQGVQNYNSVSSVVTTAYRLMNGYEMSENRSLKNIGKTNAELIEVFNSDREAFIEAGAFGAEMRRKAPFIDGSMCGGSYYFLVQKGGYSKDIVRDFFEDLCQLDTSRNQIVNMLRQRLLKAKTSNTMKLPRSVAFALLVKTWNNYIKGTTVKCLKYTAENEDYPKFILKNGEI